MPAPIIFITAHGDAEMRTLAMDEGAVEFLTKPFNDAVITGGSCRSREVRKWLSKPTLKCVETVKSGTRLVTIDGGKRSLMIAALRYSDNFVKIDGAWLFAERLLYVHWLEERAQS